MQEYDDVKDLMLKTKQILDLFKKIDVDDPLLLDTYLIIEYLQVQLLELVSEYRNLLNKKITKALREKINESLQIVINSYENIQKVLAKVYIYRQAQTELYLVNLLNSNKNEKTI